MISRKPAEKPHFLLYGVPRAKGDGRTQVWDSGAFKVDNVPLGGNVSFLDYDGVVFSAGAFTKIERGINWAEVVCISRADLDLREREFYTAIKRGSTVVFLLHYLPKRVGFQEFDKNADLFTRIAASLGIEWHCHERPIPYIESLAPEFSEYVSRFGAGYVTLSHEGDDKEFLKPICGRVDQIFGAVVAEKLFLLPSVVPQSGEQVQQIVTAAISAANCYRKRVSREIPAWAHEFGFTEEKRRHAELESLQRQVLALETEIDRYREWKAALCLQSEALVDVVVKLLDRFFGLCVVVDEKRVEDATLRDGRDSILAVFEIKGVKGNFSRANVGQVDAHRERLGLPADTPGVLIMNTMMSADSLQAKDEAPHPDIIKKAVMEHVVLLRTIDLLRLAAAAEAGRFDRQCFRQAILSESGWLKWEDGDLMVAKA